MGYVETNHPCIVSGSDSESTKEERPVVKVNNFAEFLAMVSQFSGGDDLSVNDYFDKIQEIAAAKLKLTGEAGHYSKIHSLLNHMNSKLVFFYHLLMILNKYQKYFYIYAYRILDSN